MKEISYELAGLTKLTKHDGISYHFCVIIDNETSCFTTFKIEKVKNTVFKVAVIISHLYQHSTGDI